MVLVVSAGLMIKSLYQLQQVDVGFRVDGLATLQPLPPASRYAETEQRLAYADLVTERLSAL